MAKLGRLMTAMLTPFTDSGAVDFAKAGELAQHLVASGSEGLVITGTTGESPTLTEEEKLELYRVTKRAVGPDVDIIAGTGNYSTAESIHLTREAERQGVDGVLLVVPYYNNPPQEGLYQHFKAIADSTSLPCILYNIPSRSPRNTEPATLKRLAQIDNIVALKEANSGLAHLYGVFQAIPEGFLVYSGNDNDTFAMMSLGAHGVVSVAAHLAGRQERAMVDAMARGDMATARKLHLSLVPLVDALFPSSAASPMALKAAMNSLGFAVGTPRLPLVKLPEAETAKLRDVLATCELDDYLSRSGSSPAKQPVSV